MSKNGFQLFPWQEKMLEEWADASPQQRRKMFPHLSRKCGRSWILGHLADVRLLAPRPITLVNKGNFTKTSSVGEEVLWALMQGAE